MKKIVASVSLVALGAGLSAVSAQDIEAPPQKFWNVSATLRGFYDDNPSTLPDNDPNKESTTGFDAVPSVGLEWQNDQTSVRASYAFTYRYYEKKPFGNNDNSDMIHNFNLELNHAFSERYQLGLGESFVIGQESDLLRPGSFTTPPQRIAGDNIRNYARIFFSAQFAPTFGMEFGYANEYYNYDDEGPPFPSLSGRLDRMEHRINVDARWTVAPQTVGVLGYMFALGDFTGDELIGSVGPVTNSTPVYSDARNFQGHYFYVGADHNFTPDCSGSARVGMRYTDYYNDPTADNGISPYVKASLKYNYMVESYAQLGLEYDRSPTDVVSPSTGGIAQDTDAGVIFVNVRHRIVPNLFGSGLVQFQNSIFNGGNADGDSEQWLTLGLNLEYVFNAYLAANVGYNFDNLSSDIPGRTFDRNRIYAGVKASY